MSVMPTEIRTELRDRLWKEAKDLGWAALSDVERSGHYERWAESLKIGGVLSRYMDPRKIRVYIKDSLLKPFLRTQMEVNLTDVLRVLNVDPSEEYSEVYIKPHGRRMLDGRVFCWGAPREWKSILMSVFERATLITDGRAFAAVLVDSNQAVDAEQVALIREASSRLRIERLDWL